ncbi:MAG: undecaprenyldiphospho-muramoylpentapeptide beta-N-acetylglucosaminyltransferase [Clostridiales bacterium]|nr:undecaprenyldiphospho-muramoylpentapeptide beta-N-acetylglucosaminyltransferase [Clostridiales bacterium]
MKRIVLTGGGTAGHVTPCIALLPALKKEGYDIQYIGSYNGIERKLIEEYQIPYHGISSGKLRRYFDLKNFSDPFRVIKGYYEASKILKQLNPDIVFSKGGFVSVPVVFAAKKHKIPVIIHESDMTPGLANKLAIPAAKKVCANFPETLQYLPPDKAVLTGTPIRKELFSGNKIRGLDFCGFTANKPVILIIGGSTGSKAINEVIRGMLPTLVRDYQIIHLCGKGNLDENLSNTPGYVQFEYINNELSDLFAAADLVISRAGANAICEILALRKPNILIPLPQGASRGDQILNADSFEHLGYSYVLSEAELSLASLLNAIQKVMEHKHKYIDAMNKSKLNNSIDTIIQLIKENQK